MTTLLEYLNTLYTTTWAKRRATTVDQIFEKNKLLNLMNSKGMIKYEATDGRRFEIPLAVKKTSTAKFFGKGATFTITDFDPLTIAYEYWKNLGDQIVRYWTDDKSSGGNLKKHIKFMSSKIKIVSETLKGEVEDSLWTNTGGFSALAYNGLPYLVSSSPSDSVVIHGINQATAVDGDGNYYWRNQQKDSSGAFSVYGESDMTNAMNTAQRWGHIDLLISDQTTHELGEAEALERVQVVNKEAVSLGLDHITFKGRIWVWSPKCTTGTTYMLDREHLGFTIDPAVNMVMGPWKIIPNQYQDMVTQIVQRGNTWVDKRRCHSVITGQQA